MRTVNPLKILPALLVTLFFAAGARAQNQPPPAAPGQVAGDPISDPIRANDTVRVQVTGTGGEPFSGEFKVDDRGVILMPALREVAVGGLTRVAAGALISKRLQDAKYLKRADVVVTILQRKAREAVVSGAVLNTGRKPLRDGALLSDVLGEAVPIAGADLSRVVVTRGDRRLTIDYKQFLAGRGNDDQFNPRLEDGDRIYVYAGDQPGGTVRVRGEVKDTAKVFVPIADGTTVGQVLQGVGGITDYADRTGIYIQRGEQRLAVAYDEIVKGIAGRDIPLQDKDELVIPRLERPRQYAVTGAVPRAGTFTLSSRTTLLDAVGFAGGFVDGAKRQDVTIRRKVASGQIVTLKKDFRKDVDAATEVLDGDVIDVPFGRKNAADFGQILGIVGSLTWILSSVRR
jgi:protein involved in polysaccharide export with SLBB domain